MIFLVSSLPGVYLVDELDNIKEWTLEIK